ncbi:MAG: helix-turn-helix domain-containing protein, partial [Planctomycetota bacterium]
MAGRPRTFDEQDALGRAIDLFHARGYESVGVRELIDAMGVCRQSFYDTFGDKRELFLRAIRQYCADSEGWFQERLAAGPTPLAAIRDLLRERATAAKSSSARSATGACRGCLAMNTLVEWGAEDDEVAEVLRTHQR